MCDSMATRIETVRKFFIMANSSVEFKLKVSSLTIYDLRQEYPVIYGDIHIVPFNEELEIEIKVIRKVVE